MSGPPSLQMDAKERARRKAEYYELLEESEALHDILNEHGGLVLARVGSHPPWPARFSEPGEFAKMSRYRTKRGQVCVYFFGSRNFGWVPKSAILPFSETISTFKISKRHSLPMIQAAMNEATAILYAMNDSTKRFYDRIMEKRNGEMDLPCEICNRVDDHYSMLILCDGKDCKREYHMNCLSPPLLAVPPGDWFCPECLSRKDSDEVETLPSENREALIEAQASKSALPALRGTHPRKQKKEKHKRKLHKRRLSSTSPDPETRESTLAPPKKSRGYRSSSRESSPVSRTADRTPPKKLSSKSLNTPTNGSESAGSGSGKRPPQIEIPKSRAQTTPEGDNGSADEGAQSEERCLICGYGGELVVCEFQGCTKVYHQFCLGSFPYPKDEETVWYCPRHTCSFTGNKERVGEALEFTSPKRPASKNLLWKCNHCPLAVSDEVMPNFPQFQLLTKKQRRFICPHCISSAPLKVHLGKLLEKIWSTMATNRQGVPFSGPLLCGLERADDQPKKSKKDEIDLFKVLAKIRRLEYSESSEFVADIQQIVDDAIELVAGRSEPLVEAARTMKIICDEQLEIHREKIKSLDSRLWRQKNNEKAGTPKNDASSSSKDESKWELRWRQECGPFEDKYYPRLDSRSLEEWNAHVTAAPIYITSVGMDDPDADSESEDTMEDDSDSVHRGRVGNDADASSRSASSDSRSLSFPGLSLSEGTDVVIALGELSRGSGGLHARRLGTEQAVNGLEGTDGRDLFLSPSSSEMQQMFDQQSSLLRNALEAHAVLQRSWLISQQQLLGLGDGSSSGFSVGEGRLAAELRMANNNLRQRLRIKDRLVDQLTSDHMSLRTEMEALQRKLADAQSRVQELEGKLVDTSKTTSGSLAENGSRDSIPEADNANTAESERSVTSK